MPSQFASQDLVTRAFSELLCGQVLHIDDRLCVGGTRDYWGYTGSFMALPCVEYCRVLSLGNPDLVFRIREQLIDWICTGDPKKTFYVRIDVRLAPVVLGGYARSMLRVCINTNLNNLSNQDWSETCLNTRPRLIARF